MAIRKGNGYDKMDGSIDLLSGKVTENINRRSRNASPLIVLASSRTIGFASEN